MSARGRLAVLEGSLGPCEAVLYWLAGARAFGSPEAYAASTLSGSAAAPLDTILEQVGRAMRREGRGGSRGVTAAALAAAQEDATFRYELVLRLNARTTELCEQLAPRLELLRVALEGLPTDAPPSAEGHNFEISTVHPTTPRSGAWGEHVAALVATIAVETEARELLERRYLAGRDILFREVAERWGTIADDMARLRANTAVSGTGSRRRARRAPRSDASDRTPSIERTATQRADDIALEARLAALELLGHHRRAGELLRSRLDPETHGTGSRLALFALERFARPRRHAGAGCEDEPAELTDRAAHPLDGLSPADQARQLRLLATELEQRP